MKALLFLLAIPILLLSCQKEFTLEYGDVSTNPCDTYFPLNTGTTWTYDISGTTQINTVTTPDTLIQGNTFKRVTQVVSGFSSDVFFREENGNVYGFGVAPGSSAPVLINPIRSGAAVGEKWGDTVFVNGATERFEYEMIEKNINYQVDTFHFSNVDHIQYKVRVDLPPLYNDELVQITDTWIARCIGGVETKNQVLLSGVVVSTSDQKIKSYTIR